MKTDLNSYFLSMHKMISNMQFPPGFLNSWINSYINKNSQFYSRLQYGPEYVSSFLR